ncbi:hypothetical protein [Alteromonas stellipolaris]|uniref:hypothetical protein n=1 Tax=Alteromonas stellipolaris TaxID=233316 RepID=UPI001D6A9EC7|nr:hypothetical protein [Alteromonas stellipolaris]MBZ2164318.1 hypothetical protein [Alteromonas stellipolaris]
MKIEYYQNFEKELKAGLKKQASLSVKHFVSSFESNDEIEKWVWEYLPKLEKNRHSCIRHELFVNLVYPTLKNGFYSEDYNSTLWLGKLIQNIYQTGKLFEELGGLCEIDFYRKCYEIDPTQSEASKLLLVSLLNWFSYCEHEWPSGILYGNNGATIEQCEEIRDEVQFALTLPVEAQDKEFIAGFLTKLSEYEARLNKRINAD